METFEKEKKALPQDIPCILLLSFAVTQSQLAEPIHLQRFLEQGMLLPTHRSYVNLAALEQPSFDASSSSAMLVRSGTHVLASECTKSSVKVEWFDLLPD